MTDPWTDKDTLTVAIGILFSFITAFLYEWLVSRRKKNKDRNVFSFLESTNEHLWQHYDIDTGNITKPIDSNMHLRYIDDKRLKLTWFKADGVLLGEGFITWEDSVHGKMSAHEYSTNSYRYRNVFYRLIEHDGHAQDAIFVNADDEGKKYVMLRRKSFRPN